MVGPCRAGSRPKIVSSPEVTGETPSTAVRSPNLLVSWRARINEWESLTGDLLSLARRERVRVRAVGLFDLAQGGAALPSRRCRTCVDRRRAWGLRPPAPDGGA